MFRKRKLHLTMGTMNSDEAQDIMKLDSDNLIVGFVQTKETLGTKDYHILCNQGDENKILKMFNKIRRY